MKTITAADLDSMEKIARIQLVNSLPGAKPIGLVGTIDAQGRTNLAPFSSIIHLGSIPALIGLISRPDPLNRHTFANLTETNSYTINHLHRDFVEKAHLCSARYDRDQSEFKETGLTEHYEEGVTAPFVAESRFRFALKPVETIDITSNNTILLIGEVVLIQIQDSAIADDGSVDLLETGTMASTALDTYFDLKDAVKFPYAKRP